MPEPSAQYLLPDLGEGMAEAEVVRWEVAVGDHVTRDQIVVHVQTDKADVELPVPASGTVTALGAAVGDVVPVGSPLLEFVPDEGSALPGTPVRASAVSTARVRDAAGPVTSPRDAHAQAAPPVRKLARELGIDLADVAGTGPSGRVTAADVRAHSAPGERREPVRGVRRAMARNMAAAWAEVPHITLFDEIDARPLLDAHARARTSAPTITLTAFFVRAAVLALQAAPILNASFDATSDEIVYHDACHVGIAVASDDGLVVPVVHDAQTLDLVAIGAEVARLTGAARAGHLAPETIRGATFTVSNYGTEGGRFATPIVRPPQVAILGFGAVRVRPVVDADSVIAAPALPIALSADHRIVDGRDATGFIEGVVALLADADRLAD
jgi:pyruvate/2-oxoglutarate dehydrogenase complex dihydrolipoamide acyltransferase (E2) component